MPYFASDNGEANTATAAACVLTTVAPWVVTPGGGCKVSPPIADDDGVSTPNQRDASDDTATGVGDGNGYSSNCK